MGEPHQKKICSFFMGIFTRLAPGLKHCRAVTSILAQKATKDASLVKIEASAQRFFEDSYSFTWVMIYMGGSNTSDAWAY